MNPGSATVDTDTTEAILDSIDDAGRWRTPKRRTLVLASGNLSDGIDLAEERLVANFEQLELFQRGGELMKVTVLPSEEIGKGLSRPAGTVQLHAVSSLLLLEMLDGMIEVQRAGVRGKMKTVDCPLRLADHLLARGKWKLPVLRGIIESPVLRGDGSLLLTSGYDRATRLYLHSDIDWTGIIPQEPSFDDANEALAKLWEPFDEFPFVAEQDKSVLVAAILTTLQRRLLDFGPLFGFSAPAQRSGKSLLVESVSNIATGRAQAVTAVSSKPDEMRKVIMSVLREGHLIVSLDNIEHPLRSADLAKALTQLLYSDRMLGTNKMLYLPTNLIWCATGNNLSFAGDLETRSLLCRIDSEREHPEERTFKIPDLRAHLIANRKRLVAAALTILRAYEVAGRPAQPVPPWGGFDRWSAEIRAPLIWLGMADPCQTRDRIRASSLDREVTAPILGNWRELFGDQRMLLKDVIKRANENAEFRDQLLSVAPNKDAPSQIDVRRLSAWCRDIEDKFYDGLRLSRGNRIARALTWSVTEASDRPGTLF